MITVAIVAILLGTSIAGYRSHLEKAKRSDARAFLLEAAGRMERYYSTRGKYTDQFSNLGYKNALSRDKNYTLNIQLDIDGAPYLLTVSPRGFTDDKCQSLSYSARKEQTHTGTGEIKDCWGGRN